MKYRLDQVQMIFSNFAHNDLWDDNLEEIIRWLQVPGWRSLCLGIATSTIKSRQRPSAFISLLCSRATPQTKNNSKNAEVIAMLSA